jgi:hypothetical protein
MRQETVLRHEFVEFIPDDLQPGTIYVSIRFATASHLCCCGCGNKVVTPLRPTDWKLIFDGKTVSLDPSIGNWSFACQSHYWIVRNKIKWARRWTQEEIKGGRAFDSLAKSDYFGDTGAGAAPAGSNAAVVPRRRETKVSIWMRLKKWLRGT